ncbi:DEAD/DEAH box helicase [Verrucomicrobiaceae bacterium N1E253]|uniref:DEAD-box ATP-dependent RNA helicase RhpA n=1 Tax=Oceaniferula marina TaxID=2748318 RepID=A0A851GMD0_9BACT|nr:DEAD/DEAH box helicase [Oceaniferula marina]NWK55970.1 DEAD/DEAH box helicase [Oceaniferula marina]
MSFKTFNLSQALQKALTTQGYTSPTPIQEQAIPAILAGRDVIGGAQTGTGKTAAFALPVLQLLADRNRRTPQPKALVLAPTRELAAQVHDSFKTYGKHLPLRSACIFGGVGINPQTNILRRGVDILVACPGRLLDHANQGTVDLSKVEVLVLDEADRMLDMGFIHDIRRVLKLLPENRQNLLFSATYSPEIKQLSKSVLRNPQMIELASENTAAHTVTQVVYKTAKDQKRHLLAHLIKEGQWEQVLVFTRTKHGANRLAGQLDKVGIRGAAIHGNKSQGARTRALSDFKNRKVQVLVATDIAARGLDIDQLPHVVNFELPKVAEDYIHRIGRTGRAGASGEAVSLVCVDEKKEFMAIERLLKTNIAQQKVQGFTSEWESQTLSPTPTRGRGANRGRQGNRQASSNQNGRSGKGGSSVSKGSNSKGNKSDSSSSGKRAESSHGQGAKRNSNGARRWSRRRRYSKPTS